MAFRAFKSQLRITKRVKTEASSVFMTNTKLFFKQIVFTCISLFTKHKFSGLLQ